MSIDLIISLAILLVPMVVARLLMEKALNKLDSESKLKLLDRFTKQRKYRLYFTIPIIFAYFLSLHFFAEHAILIIVTGGILYACYFITINVITFRKMKAIGVPESYRKSSRFAVCIVALGFIGFAARIFFLYHSHDQDAYQRYQAYEQAKKGVVEINAKNYPAAIADFSAAIAIDTTQSAYYTNRGTCYYNSGAMKEAKSDWIKAATMGDKDAANYLTLIKE